MTASVDLAAVSRIVDVTNCCSGSPMRILRILSTLDPVTGGPASVFGGAVIATIRQGADVECLTLQPPHGDIAHFPDYASLVAYGTTVHAVRGLRRACGLVCRRAKQFDIIHVDGCWQPLCILAVLIAKILGRAVVVTPHESLTHEDLRRTTSLVRIATKRLLRVYYRQLTNCFVFSSALERTDSLHHRHSVVVAHPVFDDARFVAPGEIRQGFAAPGRIQIGYLGRFHSKKRLEDILAAAQRTPHTSLLVAGSGPDVYETKLKALAAHSDSVTWLGFVTRQRREEFFRSIDFLVLASEYECFGMAAAEAMVRGIPVIVGRRVGVADDVMRAGAGFVVEPGEDPLLRVFARCSALTSAEYRELQKGALRAAAGYSYSAYGIAQLNAYAALKRRGANIRRAASSARAPHATDPTSIHAAGPAADRCAPASDLRNP